MTITLPRPLPTISTVPFGPPAATFARAAGRPGVTMIGVMGPNPPTPSTAELQALVERARNDDPDAWEALYRFSYPGLFAYARRRLWGLTEADDAVSETFARAFPRIRDFEWTGGGVNAWLFGILRNVVLEAQRKDGRAALSTADDDRIDDASVDGLIRDEEVAAVRAAFATLGPDDREVLELRVVGGLCADEVGVVLGKRAGAVRMAQSRALDRLRRALDQVAAGG